MTSCASCLNRPLHGLHGLNHAVCPYHALHGVKACSPIVVGVRFATAERAPALPRGLPRGLPREGPAGVLAGVPRWRRLRACSIVQLFPLRVCLNLKCFVRRCSAWRLLCIELKECWIDWNIELVVVMDRLRRRLRCMLSWQRCILGLIPLAYKV
jgi:hypothetical protein